MSIKFSCPSCSNKVQLVPANLEDPKSGLFKCDNCGAIIEWDKHRRRYWWVVAIVLIAVANLFSNFVVVLGLGGSESTADWIGFGLSVALLAVYLKWSHRLVVVDKRE